LDVYEKLGVKKYINAWGTVTKIGGSIMPPPVLAAMTEAAQSFVDIEELLRKAGNRIAELVGAEAGFITCGAAAALSITTAACMTGTDPVKIVRLPDSEGMKNEVIIHKAHRTPYDHAIRQVGAKFVEVGFPQVTFPWELEKAINGKTAAIVYLPQFEPREASIPLSEAISVAKKTGIPLIVNASAELPPPENLRKFIQMGADLVIFSGGKDLCGPQSSGLILGRKDLIEACMLNSNPFFSIGRPLKVGKEEIIGLLTAIELYLKQDFKSKFKLWEDQVNNFIESVAELQHMIAQRRFPTDEGIQPICIPRVYIDLDEAALGITKEEVVRQLRDGEPGIFIGVSKRAIILNPQMLRPGEEQIVAQRFKQILLQAKTPYSKLK